MSWLTDGSSKQRCCCFKRRRERFLLFPSPPFSFPSLATFPFLFVPVYVCVFQLPFLFLFRYRPSPLSLTVPLPCFQLPRFLSFFSFGPFPFRSFLSLLSVPSFFLSPSCVLALGGIYRVKGAGASLLPPYCCTWGAGLCCHATALGWLASGRGSPGLSS